MNAPRIPRQTRPSLTVVQVATAVLLSVALVGLLYIACVEIAALVRFAGWMLSQPVVEVGR